MNSLASSLSAVPKPPVRSQKLITASAIDQTISILEKYHFAQFLTAAEKDLLIKHIKIKKYYHEQIIYTQNSICKDVNIVLDGALKMGWTTPSGKYHIDTFIPAETMINIVPIMTEQPFVHDHISQGYSIIANINGDVFKEIIKHNVQAIYSLLELICIRTQLQRERTVYNSIGSLKTRLAKELVYLINYHSYQRDQKIFLNLKLNQENFSELLQSTRQSINKELSTFARDGIIEVKYNQINILNYEQLLHISQCENLDFTTQFI